MEAGDGYPTSFLVGGFVSSLQLLFSLSPEIVRQMCCGVCCKEEPGMLMLQLLQELMFCYAKFIRDIIKCYCLHSNRHNTLPPFPSLSDSWLSL